MGHLGTAGSECKQVFVECWHMGLNVVKNEGLQQMRSANLHFNLFFKLVFEARKLSSYLLLSVTPCLLSCPPCTLSKNKNFMNVLLTGNFFASG
jgi:hypothetical protein